MRIFEKNQNRNRRVRREAMRCIRNNLRLPLKQPARREFETIMNFRIENEERAAGDERRDNIKKTLWQLVVAGQEGKKKRRNWHAKEDF